MPYSIGAAAAAIGVPTSTVRYYDKEGLLPFVGRSDSGLRVFQESDIESLRMIECLKRTGMPLKDIRQFMEWCHEGDSTLEQRRAMFHARRDAVREQIRELQETLEVVEYKCWFYETAVAAGSAQVPREMPAEEIPERHRAAFESLHAEVGETEPPAERLGA
ncbi:MAG: MerR family transcriptional regulator [Atopobiaceae bacterium]|jgi:DNA-binding transcriptional MerR regulator|nr:MerR family transcriptional regulator [Atopobiaceae bacterium]